jgi:hypothetical protein
MSGEELNHAWKQALDSFLLGESRTQALTDIALVWIENDGYQVIRSICRSIPNMVNQSQILRSVLERTAQTEPRVAFELAMECHENQMDLPLIDVVKAWAQREPLEALEPSQILSKQLFNTHYNG